MGFPLRVRHTVVTTGMKRSLAPRLGAAGVLLGRALGLLALGTPAAAQGPAPFPVGGPLAVVLPEDELLARALELRRWAASGSPADLRRVVEALADPAPLVADTAQLACAALTTTEGVAELLGSRGLQHPSPAVRLRAAEALGRTSARYRAEALEALLPRREDEECRVLLRSVERLAQRGLLDGDVEGAAQWIQTWIRGKYGDETRAAALSAVAAMSRERGARYASAVLRQRPEPFVRGAALEVARALALPEAFLELHASLRAKDARVRAHALRVAAWRGDREALMWLVDVARSDPRLGLRWRAVEALEYLTSAGLGLDADAWAEHVAGLPLDWTAASNRNAQPIGTLRHVSVEELAALEPRTDRGAVVVHLAPAREAPAAPWRVTRRDRVRPRAVAPPVEDEDVLDAVHAVLGRFEAGAKVDVFRANARHDRRGRALVPVEAEDHPAFGDFLAAHLPCPEGDVLGATLAAVRDPEVDRVLLVTRGGPRTGQRVVLDLVVDEVLAACRVRAVAVDVVLIAPAPDAAAALLRLAAATGGRALQVGGVPF